MTTSYENPLAPDIPDDGTLDSCADPTVIQGQEGETVDGEQVWYMYCTTDPLNDEDVDAEGDPIFHRIPTMVSTDLVNWTYVGDAFPADGGDIPAWIAPNAAFWAPEVVHSSATDQYYLFVTVTETTAEGGGSDTSVATARSALRWLTARPAPGTSPRSPSSGRGWIQRRTLLVLLDFRSGRPRRHRHGRGASSTTARTTAASSPRGLTSPKPA